MANVILDVRERDEYKAEHIENSINIPLSELPAQAPGLLSNLSGKNIVLMCLSGKRAQMAKNQIERFAADRDCRLEIYQGGLKAWKSSGQPTVALKGGHIPVMRQVLLVAGLLNLTFFCLGFFVSTVWYFGAAFIGFGLTFAGATGFCLMGELLSRMPWNRGVSAAPAEQCLKN